MSFIFSIKLLKLNSTSHDKRLSSSYDPHYEPLENSMKSPRTSKDSKKHCQTTPKITITAPSRDEEDDLGVEEEPTRRMEENIDQKKSKNHNERLPPPMQNTSPNSHQKSPNTKTRKSSSFAASKNFLVQRRKTIHDILNFQDIFNSLIGGSNSENSKSKNLNSNSFMLNKTAAAINTPNSSSSSSNYSASKPAYHSSFQNLAERTTTTVTNPSSSNTISTLCKNSLTTMTSITATDIAESLIAHPLSPPISNTSSASLNNLHSLPPPHPGSKFSQSNQQSANQTKSNNQVFSHSELSSPVISLHTSNSSTTALTSLNTCNLSNLDAPHNMNHNNKNVSYSKNDESDMILNTSTNSSNNDEKLSDFGISRELVMQGSVQLLNVMNIFFYSE
jgi:hypothetical protein